VTGECQLTYQLVEGGEGEGGGRERLKGALPTGSVIEALTTSNADRG
jgi:hypothetical protein